MDNTNNENEDGTQKHHRKGRPKKDVKAQIVQPVEEPVVQQIPSIPSIPSSLDIGTQLSAAPIHNNSQDISGILNTAFKRYNTAVNEEYTEVNHNLEGLQHVVSEYLSDFMIVGHTLLGQRVIIRFAKTAKDYDGLSDLSKKTLIKLFMEEQPQQNRDD